MDSQKTCKKCGNCCRKGGPALHGQDLPLIKSGKIPMSALITIRKGELAFNPVTGLLQPVGVELVKIIGAGRQWDCCYYDGTTGCTIYDHRPHACRLLKCWDTDEVLALVEKDTLSRFDILAADDPLVPVIKEHERICPCEDLWEIREKLGRLSDAKKKELEKKVREEIRFRMRIVADYQLSLSKELFCFGRPFFQLLKALGVGVSESGTGIVLRWKK
jgi:Fe-S-cluster containining protein